MYNTCVSSTLSLKCDGRASFSFNGYAYCTKDGFNKYPFCNSSSSSCCSCCCCANSMNRVALGPSYVCGLRQSTLIQWSPCRKMILRSLDRCNTNFPVLGIERKLYYEKKSGSFNERGRRARNGRIGFQEKNEMPSVCDVYDEAEALLSLLCEDLDEECVDLRERNGKSRKKRVVEIKENDVENNHIGKKKGSKLGVGKNWHEIESTVCVPTKENKIRNEHRREKEKDGLLRNAREVVGRNSVKQRVRKEDNEASLSSENREADGVKEEREYLLRKSNFERERKEDLSRREDHRQKMRKEGSSCSSYYSFSSTGELDSDNEVQIEQEQIHGELSKSEEFTRYGEVGRHEDYSEEHGVIMSKEDAYEGSYVAPAGIDGGWRKKSEKRLTDISIEDNEFRKESSQKQSRILGVHESNYEKEFSSPKAYDDRKQKSTEKSETRMKHKEFLDTETMTRMVEARDENRKKTADIIRREDESGKHSEKIRESQIQEVDAGRTFTKEIESSVRKMSNEVSSSRGRSSAYITDEQHNLASEVASRGKSQHVARDEHKLSTYISQRQSKTRLTNQEEYKTHSLKSSLESRGQSSQTSAEFFKGSEQTTALMHAKDSSMACQNDVNVVNENETDIRISRDHSSSKLLLSSSTVESMSGFAAQRFSPVSGQSGSSVPMQQETYGEEVRRDETGEKLLEFVSPEDGLGSTNRLQKYSAEYVGEFVEKVRHEISISEIEREKRSSETNVVYEGGQDNPKISCQNEQESQSKEEDSTSSSLGSKTAGPSDEMWVTQPSIQQSSPPSVQEKPGTELKDDTQTVGDVDIKRTGHSFWHIIADVVRMRWISRSSKHSLTSGGTSSSHHSTSEAQISDHVPEGSDSASVKKEKSSSDQHKKEKFQTQSQGEVSNSSRDQIKPEWEDASSSILPSTSVSSASNEEILQKTVEGTSTGTMIAELSSPSPAMSARPPALDKTTEKVVPSASTEISIPAMSARPPVLDKTTEQVAPSASTEISIPEVKDGEVRQRRFQRANQIVRDRFDEWEEAYRTETEQRKVDEMFMREALLEAKKAASNWEVPVGAVLVQGGKIIARGCNLVEELRDSTAHAEMICIREASNALQSWRLSDATLYVTLEPCPMCAGAILQARIDTVVWGAPNKLLGADGSWIRLFPDGDGGDGQQSTDKPPAPVHPFHPKMTIRRGVLALECAEAMQQFFQLRRKKEKKSDLPPSRLAISRHPNKFLSKMHDAFHLMFCL